MTDKQHDAHIRARRALARRVLARRAEWGGMREVLNACRQRGGKTIDWARYDAIMMRAAYGAISAHDWREGWGNKLSRYHTFGPPQRVIGTLADVPSHEIHAIMCRMHEHVGTLLAK